MYLSSWAKAPENEHQRQKTTGARKSLHIFAEPIGICQMLSRYWTNCILWASLSSRPNVFLVRKTKTSPQILDGAIQVLEAGCPKTNKAYEAFCLWNLNVYDYNIYIYIHNIIIYHISIYIYILDIPTYRTVSSCHGWRCSPLHHLSSSPRRRSAHISQSSRGHAPPMAEWDGHIISPGCHSVLVCVSCLL